MRNLFVLINKACLENLSFKFQLSQTSTGILVALGITLPELTTNTLSVFSSKPEMIGYGLGTILGSGVFGISIICILFINRLHLMLWDHFDIFQFRSQIENQI